MRVEIYHQNMLRYHCVTLRDDEKAVVGTEVNISKEEWEDIRAMQKISSYLHCKLMDLLVPATKKEGGEK